MNFERVINTVGNFLQGERRHAVAGAIALHACGISRATQDLDLVTEADAQDGLVSFLESLGYETLYRSPGYSHAGLLERVPSVEASCLTFISTATCRPPPRTWRLLSQPRPMATDEYLRFLALLTPPCTEALRQRVGPRGEPFTLDAADDE